MKRSAKLAPREDQDQAALAAFLDLLRLRWCHVPNGGHRHIATASKLKAQGVKAGVPDVLIFDPPPNVAGAVGAAIELKRKHGGSVSQAQYEWLDALKARGWAVEICHGLSEAIAQLNAWGYRRK